MSAHEFQIHERLNELLKLLRLLKKKNEMKFLKLIEFFSHKSS